MISMIRMYADDTLVHTEHKKQYYHHIQNWKIEKEFSNAFQYMCIYMCVYIYVIIWHC